MSAWRTSRWLAAVTLSAYLPSLVVISAPGAALAQERPQRTPSVPFAGEPVTGVYAQERARFDRLYAKGRFSKAFDIAMKGLAWRGDKYAQYMIGIMYWHGQGVSKDEAKACAWFRVAAQRGHPLLEELRDDAHSQMTPDEMVHANAYYQEMKKSTAIAR